MSTTKKTGRNAPRGRQGTRLKEWKHLKQEDFNSFMERWKVSRSRIAQKLGVSVTSISNWRAGRRVPCEVIQLKLKLMIDGIDLITGR